MTRQEFEAVPDSVSLGTVAEADSSKIESATSAGNGPVAAATHHLTEQEQKVMHNALVSSVKLVDEATHVSVPVEPTDETLNAPRICYEVCKAHAGWSFTLPVQLTTITIKKVCPICEPPEAK